MDAYRAQGTVDVHARHLVAHLGGTHAVDEPAIGHQHTLPGHIRRAVGVDRMPPPAVALDDVGRVGKARVGMIPGSTSMPHAGVSPISAALHTGRADRTPPAHAVRTPTPGGPRTAASPEHRGQYVLCTGRGRTRPTVDAPLDSLELAAAQPAVQRVGRNAGVTDLHTAEQTQRRMRWTSGAGIGMRRSLASRAARRVGSADRLWRTAWLNAYRAHGTVGVHARYRDEPVPDGTAPRARSPGTALCPIPPIGSWRRSNEEPSDEPTLSLRPVWSNVRWSASLAMTI